MASTSDDLNISTPAVVAWGSGTILTDVTLDLRQRVSNNTALFKIRAALTLKNSPLTRTAFFLFVYPELIRSLEPLSGADVERGIVAESGAATAPDIARAKLGIDVTCLRFELSEPLNLIGPKDAMLTPKNRASGQTLDSLRALARQDSFFIYFPQNVVSKARLITLCNVICAGTSRTMKRQADIVTLYGGKGGQVLTDPSVVSGVTIDADTTSINPPAYNEIELGPPPPPLAIPDDGRASSSQPLSRTVID